MSQHFKIGTPTDWEKVENKSALEFVTNKARTVKLEVICDAFTALTYHDPEGVELLIGSGQGKFSVEFTTKTECAVLFETDDDGTIYVKGSAPDQRVRPDRTDKEVFTKMNPKSRVSPEVQAILRAQKLGDLKRQGMYQQHEARIAAREAVLDEKLNKLEKSSVTPPKSDTPPAPADTPPADTKTPLASDE